MNKTLEQTSIDIILPNFNSASYVSETIESVINQTFKNWKLLSFDDCSNYENQKNFKIL